MMPTYIKGIVLSLSIFISFPTYSQSPPSTEVILFEINRTDGVYRLNSPKNISNNPGYDNQPSFLPDNSGILFSSAQNGQTEVVQYNIKDGTKQFLTHTDGSEYSPTVIPEGHFFSSIRLEKDGTQLLYKYPLDMSEAEVLVQDLKIGYHCWISNTMIAAFVLGEPNTLQLCNTQSGIQKVLDDNIGRSLHKIPGIDSTFSYISKKKKNWTIFSMNPFEGKTKSITKTLEGSEDMAWTPDGVIFMGQGSVLYQFDTENRSEGWVMVSDLTEFEFDGITRLAVSPDGKYLAVVVNE